MELKPGDWVAWKWLSGVAEGQIIEIKHEKVQIESKGKFITRNGTVDNPAVIIEHKSGNKVLKLKSELLTKAVD